MFRSVDALKHRYLVISAAALIGLFGIAAGRSPAGQSEAVGISDAELAERVIARLADDPEIDATRIHVSAEDGNVWLDGEVAIDAVMQRAQALARGVPGVERLSSGLRIRAPRLVPRASDDEFVTGVKAKLEANRIGPAVDVESRGGVVTLTGRLEVAG